MKLQQLTTKFNVITNSATLESKSIALYDDYTKFVDFGMNDNKSYISVCVDDAGTVGYIYASSTLWTNTTGEPTKCHVFDYMGGNGVVMHAYTKIPNETDELIETFTNSSETTSLEPFNLIDNIEDFPYGAMIYLVSSKGNNGSDGSGGGYGSTSYDSSAKSQRYYNGSGGAGGSSGAPGKGVLVKLELAEFLSDGTPDFDNAVSTGTIRHEGEGGAAGGGGGGGAGWARAYGENATRKNVTGGPGSGGSKGYANVSSQTNKIRIPRNVAVKCSSFLGHTGPRGNSGAKGGSGGGSFTVSNYGHESSFGGSGGAGGSYGSTSGGAGAGADYWNGGRGGNGASVNSPTTKTTVDTEINGKPVYTATHTDSSNFTAANNLASTGGMALTRIIPIYDE